MGVTRCSLIAKNATLSIDNNFRRIYTHDFLVTTNDESMLQGAVFLGAQAVGPDILPVLWTDYNVWNSGTGAHLDEYAFLDNFIVKRQDDDEGNRTHWIITAVWKPPEPGTTSSDPPVENPLDRPVKYSMEWANYTRLIDKDNSGNPIFNSAGDLFDPPVEIDDARPVLVAVKNMWPLDDIIALSIQFKNAVNTDTFYGATLRKAKVESIVSGSIQEENGVPFYAVTFRVQFNNDKWDVHLVDRGRQVLVADATGTGFHKDFPRKYTAFGTPKVPTEYLDEANLNTDGTQRDEGLSALFKPPLASSGFRIYPEVTFSGLGI